MTTQLGIIGTGAIGGYCAIKLALAGFDVHCLLRSDYQFVKENGLKLISDDKTTSVSVHAYQNIQDMPSCDIILVTIKSTENEKLKSMLPKIMHKDSIVVILQNGIGIEQEIAQYIDPNKIIGGICMLKVSKIAPGQIRHYGLNAIEIAQYFSDSNREGISPQLEKISKFFDQAGIYSVSVAHLPTLRWKKLAGNIPLNGLSVVLNAYTQDIINDSTVFPLLCDITNEVINVAKRLGAHLPDDFFQYRLDVFKKLQKMENNYSSMKEDFNAKRPLELHAIYENALSLAKSQGIEMPLSEMLYRQLVFLNQMNLGKRN